MSNPSHSLIVQLDRLLITPDQVETHPRAYPYLVCPICGRNQLRDAPRVYCQFEDDDPEGRILKVVVGCFPCLDQKHTGLRTLSWGAFLHRLIKKGSNHSQPQPKTTLSALAFKLAKGVHDARDLRGLEDDGCALCDNCWDNDRGLMVMCSLNADGDIEHYVMVCEDCGSKIDKDDDVILLPIAEFRTRILAQMAR